MHRDSVTDGGIYVGAMFYGIVTVMFNGLGLFVFSIPFDRTKPLIE